MLDSWADVTDTKYMNRTAHTHRDIALDRNLAAIEDTADRAAERYTAAIRTTRYGSTPAIREAARAEAQRLRPVIDRYYPKGA